MYPAAIFSVLMMATSFQNFALADWVPAEKSGEDIIIPYEYRGQRIRLQVRGDGKNFCIARVEGDRRPFMGRGRDRKSAAQNAQGLASQLTPSNGASPSIERCGKAKDRLTPAFHDGCTGSTCYGGSEHLNLYAGRDVDGPYSCSIVPEIGSYSAVHVYGSTEEESRAIAEGICLGGGLSPSVNCQDVSCYRSPTKLDNVKSDIAGYARSVKMRFCALFGADC